MYILPIANENQKAYNITIKRGKPQEVNEMYTLTLNDEQMEIVSQALSWYQKTMDKESKSAPNRDKAKVYAHRVEDIFKVRLDLGLTTRNGGPKEFSGWRKQMLDDIYETEKAYAKKEGI